MKSKELFHLVMLYMTDPHQKKQSDDYKKMSLSEIQNKFEELKDRLNTVNVEMIQYALDTLYDKKKIEKTGKKYQIISDIFK